MRHQLLVFAGTIAISTAAYSNIGFLKSNSNSRSSVDTQSVAERFDGTSNRMECTRLLYSAFGHPTIRLDKEKFPEHLANFKRSVGQKVVGQDLALDILANSLSTWDVDLGLEGQKIQALMFVGPTGVGKSMTAEELVVFLGADKSKLLTISGERLGEAHFASSLNGSPPGYLGHGEQSGLLSAKNIDAHKFKSKTGEETLVILFDEVEKSHPRIFANMLGIIQTGKTLSEKNEKIHFPKRTILILTTNAGGKELLDFIEIQKTQAANYGKSSELMNAAVSERLKSIMSKSLNKHFSPEQLGRTEFVPFLPLRDEHIYAAVENKLFPVIKSVWMIKESALLITPEAILHLTKQSKKEDSAGARGIDRVLKNQVGAPLSRIISTEQIPERSVIELNFNKNTQELDFDVVAQSIARADIVSILTSYLKNHPDSKALDLSLFKTEQPYEQPETLLTPPTNVAEIRGKPPKIINTEKQPLRPPLKAPKKI